MPAWFCQAQALLFLNDILLEEVSSMGFSYCVIAEGVTKWNLFAPIAPSRPILSHVSIHFRVSPPDLNYRACLHLFSDAADAVTASVIVPPPLQPEIPLFWGRLRSWELGVNVDFGISLINSRSCCASLWGCEITLSLGSWTWFTCRDEGRGRDRRKNVRDESKSKIIAPRTEWCIQHWESHFCHWNHKIKVCCKISRYILINIFN